MLPARGALLEQNERHANEVFEREPALAKKRVWTSGTDRKPTLVAAKGPITIKHLLTHTSGFIYGFGDAPIDKRYQKADPYAAASMDAFVAAMAKLPLAFQPGGGPEYCRTCRDDDLPCAEGSREPTDGSAPTASTP